MKAISSMATRQVLSELAAAAAAEGLPALEIESVGGVEAIGRVRAGETFDLVFLAADALAEIAGEGHVDAASVTPIVESSVAVAVPSPTACAATNPARPAFADAAGLRQAILRASRIGYSTGPSGAALIRMIAEWGLLDEIADRLVQASPGIPVARLLADGEVDIGLQQLSELVGQPGVRILGTLPPDCEIRTVFAGAIGTRTSIRDQAAGLLDFLRSASSVHIKERNSFAAPTARHDARAE